MSSKKIGNDIINYKNVANSNLKKVVLHVLRKIIKVYKSRYMSKTRHRL